jgi:hypothetical protein
MENSPSKVHISATPASAAAFFAEETIAGEESMP